MPRYVIPGQPQHVIQRGNNRQPVFGADADYVFYLKKLAAAAERYECEIHAYVLMTNHVHLLVTPHTRNGISKMMQAQGRCYVQYFNNCHQRTGTLWEGRYKATLIDTENYLFTCMRYIELNPVRVEHMVEHPSEYPWSSYRYNALGENDAIITPHELYNQLGTTYEERLLAYRQLFHAHIPDATLEAIRHATNKAWVLGSERFKIKMERMLHRPVVSGGQGGDRRSAVYRKNRKNSTSLTP